MINIHETTLTFLQLNIDTKYVHIVYALHIVYIHNTYIKNIDPEYLTFGLTKQLFIEL